MTDETSLLTLLGAAEKLIFGFDTSWFITGPSRSAESNGSIERIVPKIVILPTLLVLESMSAY